MCLICFQSDPYWTVETLTARDRGRMGNQTVCSLVELLRLAAKANSSALLKVRRPPPEHPRYRTWFMDALWAVQKAGITQKRVRTVGHSIIILWLLKNTAWSTLEHLWLPLRLASGIVPQVNRSFTLYYYNICRTSFWHKTVLFFQLKQFQGIESTKESFIQPKHQTGMGYNSYSDAAVCLTRVSPCPLCLCQVTWTPDTDRGRVRGLQQTANEKLSVEEMRQRGLTSLTLHYSKASTKDIQ